MRVLIADDHPLYREAVISHVRQLEPDADVAEAATLTELHQAIQAHGPPDLILLGFCIPGMSSAALKKLIHELPNVPVAIISGPMSNAEAHAAVHAGVRGYIPSTTSPEYFNRAVQLLLAGGASAPADVFVDTTRPRVGGWQDALSMREIDVLKGIVRGLSNKEIARELGMAEVTVKLHLRNVYQKMKVRSRVEAAVMASRAGIT